MANRALRILSTFSGFERSVTVHCFRHMVAQALYNKSKLYSLNAG